jgi:hypothetical protein
MKYRLILLVLINIHVNSQVVDINGKVYQTTVIGSNTWINENLSVDKFNNGTIIYQAKNFDDWTRAGKEKVPAWCYYDFNPDLSYMGKLYNWYVVSSELEISPKGWHVPADWEWESLDGNKIQSIFRTTGGYLSYDRFKLTPDSFSPTYFGPWHSNDTSTPYDIILDKYGTSYIQHCFSGCSPESGFTIRCIKDVK